MASFDEALSTFQQNITPAQRNDFRHSTAQEFYKYLVKLQQDQEKTRSLCSLRRIEKYVHGMEQFSRVIEVFVQAKPEILSFIWGPTKLLLQLASTYTRAFDKLLNALEQIGDHLPLFERFNGLFPADQGVRNALVRYYGDLLSFYSKALKFFGMKTLKRVLKSMWSPFEDTFGPTLQNLKRHQELVGEQATAAHMDVTQSNILQKDLEKWLDPADYSWDCDLVEGTGAWLIQENTIHAWLDLDNSTSRLLWLTGIPGSGKSFLSTALISHITRTANQNDVVISFFLRNGNDSINKFACIMRTLIYQMLRKQQSVILPFLDQQYSLIRPQLLQSSTQFEELLETLFANLNHIYLVIDGLDEIDPNERKKLMSSLMALHGKSENLRVFFSSRKEIDIADTLSIYPSLQVSNGNDGDISKYVDYHGEEVFGRFVPLAPETENTIRKIIEEVKERAKGMFLLARLILHDLQRQTSLAELEDAGRNLPSGLEEAYGRILERLCSHRSRVLSEGEKTQAKKIMAWVICSTRSLKSSQIQSLLAIRSGDKSLNTKMKLIKRLEQLCGPLLEIDHRGVVRIVHYTAKEFLIDPKARIETDPNWSGPFIKLAEDHSYLATTCLTYLTFDCFSRDSCTEKRVLSGDYFFLEYAVLNWTHHVRRATEAAVAREQISEVIEPLQVFIGCWKNSSPTTAVSSHTQCRGRRLEFIPDDIYFAIMDYEKWNLTSNIAIEDLDRNPWKLRHSVARIRELAEELAESFPEGSSNRLTLTETLGDNIFKCQYSRCVKYIDGYPSRVERDDHLKQHLLPFKCGLSYCPYSTLGFANKTRLERHILKEHPADANLSQSMDSLSDLLPMLKLEDSDSDVLFDAISAQDHNLVREYLRNNPSPQDTSHNGLSPIHCAAIGGSTEILSMLFDSGSLASTTRGPEGVKIKKTPRLELKLWGDENPLYIAAFLGHDQMVQYLLKRGVDVKAQYFDYRKGSISAHMRKFISKSPLQAAIINGHTDIVRQLLEAASIDKHGDISIHMPLSSAIRNGNIEIARLLLESGLVKPNGDPQDSDWSTDSPLSLASAVGSVECVQMLLENGADISIAQGKRTKSWACARFWRYITQTRVNIMELTLASNNLKYKARARDIMIDFDITRLLLENGANANQISNNNNTPLYALVARGNPKDLRLMQLMLAYGADPELELKSKGKGKGKATSLKHWDALVELGLLNYEHLIPVSSARAPQISSGSRSPQISSIASSSNQLELLVSSNQPHKAAATSTDIQPEISPRRKLLYSGSSSESISLSKDSESP